MDVFVNNFILVLQLLGGVGLFLYGMHLMGDSLKKLAGGQMEAILAKFTTSKNEAVGRLKGFGLGTIVTAIIQSSAATTIMLIGFVNAGIMTLGQTIAVVFGANVGSTATAQIIRLADISGGSGALSLLNLLKPKVFAYALLCIGAFIMLFAKKKRPKDIAGIMVGLGTLFVGMTTMEDVFEGLKDSDGFKQLFVSFSNPLIGFAIGLGLTALIQSSSASVGILQSLTVTGITYATVVPVVIGINVGKCMTILLGAIGANKKAKRVSLVYLLFNIIGAIVFMVGIYGINALVSGGFSFWDTVVNRGNIADFHLIFNLVMAVILLPFTKQISNLTGKIIHDTDEERNTDKILESLDERLFDTPTTAIEQSRKVMCHMIDSIMENYYISTGLMYEFDAEKRGEVEINEKFIDKCETALNEYLLKVTSNTVLTRDQRKIASELLNSVSDLERIGDHCMNMAEIADAMRENKISFSDKGNAELQIIITAVEKILDLTFTAFKTDDQSMTLRVEILDEMINELKETIKEHHVNRLQTGECSIEGGFYLVDTLTDLERIGGHCANIVHHVTKRFAAPSSFDEMHGHAYSVDIKNSDDYKALYVYYEQVYLKPIRKYNANVEAIASATQDVEVKPQTESAVEAVSAEEVPAKTDESADSSKIPKKDKKKKEEKKKKH